ncbi:MAG TPA: hypothetical protein VFN61_16205 [Acidimicrobiales bacterium]|nr:hypothetical protein [Acidimicrobiales bacterium]
MNRRTSRLLRAMAFLPAVPLLLGASAAVNSEQSKPASQIVKDAVAATRQAKDFLVAGTINAGGTSMTLHLAMSARGGGGSIGIPKVTMDIITSGKYAYIKADEASWVALGAGDKQTAKQIAGRWIRVASTTSGFSNFVQLTYSDKFLQALFTSMPGFTKQSGAHQLNGHPVIVLVDAQHESMDVAATGNPYIVRVASPAKGGTTGALDFSQFGTVKVPQPPANYLTLPGV